MLDSLRQSRPGGLGIDASYLILATVFVGILSGSQQWATSNTPDSEFYGSLGVFGSEVTERAPTAVYYWTRLGYIAPMRLFTVLLGGDVGQALFRLALILTVLTSLFILLRPRVGRLSAVLVASALGTNTVLLSFVGNSYVTGTALAITMLALALTYSCTEPEARWQRITSGGVVTGALTAWALMCNPYSALLLLCAVACVLAGRLLSDRLRGVRGLALFATSAVPGGLIAYAGFILIGSRIFPGLDWLATYRYWNSVIRQSDYLVDAFSWRLDNALLVPACVAVLAFVALVVQMLDAIRLGRTAVVHGSEQVDSAQVGDASTRIVVSAFVGVGGVVFALVYLWRSPGVTLEWPQYQAMLWAPAIISFALMISALLPRLDPVPMALVLSVCVLVTIFAGHWRAPLALDSARWLAVALVLVMGLISFAGSLREPRAIMSSVIVVLLMVGLIPAGFQVLQNSRRSPFVDDPNEYYSNAFLPNAVAQQVSSSQAAERWLLARTTPEDTVMTWVDAEWAKGEESLMAIASYQLDGPNRITAGRAVEGSELTRAGATRPTVIAMYAKSLGVAAGFRSGLPAAWHATDPECKRFPWPDPLVPTAYVCLTRVTL